MAYTPKYGTTRTSGIMKTKELAGKSVLFNLGENNPINHNSSYVGEHTHIADSDRYTYAKPVTTGTKRQSRSGRKKLAKSMAAAANAQAEGFEGTQYNTQGFMKGGKSGSIKLFTDNNILEAKTGTRGGGSYGNAVETNATYKPVNYRDVAREIKRSGSASITNGVVSPGTDQTETATGFTSRDVERAAYAAKRKTRKEEQQNLKARREGERARAILERKQSREKKLAERNK